MADAVRQHAPSDWDITHRVARYAFDRLTFAEPASAVGLGTVAVGTIAAAEGSLFLHQPPQLKWHVRARFIARYASYNIIPSLIWGTQAPTAIVSSSSYLSEQMKPTNQWLYSATTLPSKQALWIRMLCSLRGAVAGSVVLSNVIVMTSLWQRAREEYANRIRLGREPPLISSRQSSSSSRQGGCTIRLAGVHSDVTELSLHRRGPGSLWPVFEDATLVQRLVARYAEPHTKQLPRVPVYWQVDDGQYSKATSWDGMKVPEQWLFAVQGERERTRMLYLEADATSGDESALSLQHRAHYYDEKDIAEGQWHGGRKRWKWDHLYRGKGSYNFAFTNNMGDDSLSGVSFSDLDLDLKEVAQGFRRLADLAQKEASDGSSLQIRRVLLVDPTVIIESGGGRQTSVRDLIEELGLADILIDARASVLHAILNWLEQAEESNSGEDGNASEKSQLRPVILETPAKAWFHSIRSELRKHGYDVIDREVALNHSHGMMPPMLVYERSSADTVNTIRQYLERGIVKDPSRVCALLTGHDGLDEVDSLNDSMAATGTSPNRRANIVGCVCSSDIHDRVFEWVRTKSMEGVPAQTIQKELDAGTAWRR